MFFYVLKLEKKPPSLEGGGPKGRGLAFIAPQPATPAACGGTPF